MLNTFVLICLFIGHVIIKPQVMEFQAKLYFFINKAITLKFCVRDYLLDCWLHHRCQNVTEKLSWLNILSWHFALYLSYKLYLSYI